MKAMLLTKAKGVAAVLLAVVALGGVFTVHRSVLTLMDGEKPVAFGLVVDADGWAVTKSSEVPANAVTCRLADGRRLEASVAGRDRDHDLALLRLSAEGPPAAAWAERPPHVGQVLVAVGPDPWPLAFGIVASETRELPGSRGVLGFDVAPAGDGQRGVQVKAVSLHRPQTAAVIRRGDLIRRVEGGATPDTEAFAKAIDKLLQGPKGRPGERLRLTILRDGQERTVAAPVEPPYVISYRHESWSTRHDGFPAVFVYDGVTLASECGGPLVGADGKVAAVVIAPGG
jgi:S1-C subfamily serine protease